MLDTFMLTMGGVTTPPTVFPLLWEDHVNNHVSLRVPPTPEHRYTNTVSSWGHPLQIKRYKALQHGQHSTMSSRGCVLTPDQHSIRSSWGCILEFLSSSHFYIDSCNPCIVSLNSHTCNQPNCIWVTP